MTAREKIRELVRTLRKEEKKWMELADDAYKNAYQRQIAADGLELTEPKLSDEQCEKVTAGMK